MTTSADAVRPLLDAIEERRKRALREILTVNDDVGGDDRVRKVVVDQVNDLARLAGHLLTSIGGQLDSQAGLNRVYLERIVELLDVDVGARLADDQTPAPPVLHGRS